MRGGGGGGVGGDTQSMVAKIAKHEMDMMKCALGHEKRHV